MIPQLVLNTDIRFPADAGNESFAHRKDGIRVGLRGRAAPATQIAGGRPWLLKAVVGGHGEGEQGGQELAQNQHVRTVVRDDARAADHAWAMMGVFQAANEPGSSSTREVAFG